MVPYNNVASDYLETRYFRERPVDANAAMSIPDTVSMLLIPILGFYVDRTGGRVNVILMGSLALIAGHWLLATGVSRACAIVALFILGFGYSSLLSFWACVPALVRVAQHSTAYGILTTACNLSVALIPILVAPIISADPTYSACGHFFALLATVALLLALYLASVNVQKRLGLNLSTRQKVKLSPGLYPTMAEVMIVPTLVGNTYKNSTRLPPPPSISESLHVELLKPGKRLYSADLDAQKLHQPPTRRPVAHN